MYQDAGKIDKTAWVTDPRVPDPENLPQPLGWCLLVRPYPVTTDKENPNALTVSSTELDYLNHVSNIGRVVSMGDSCYTKQDHKDKNGIYKPWVKVGDFVSFPKHAGSKRKFKGVSYVLLVDDEIVERLPDPLIFDEGIYQIDIPKEDLIKYNSIYK